MAIFHLSAKMVSRGSGRSCVAAAAYRAGARLEDERQGLLHDYTRRSDVRETWMQAPEGVPAWSGNRQDLWTHVDQAEKRKDAQTARELEIALPRELTMEQQRELVRGYVQEQLVSRGMVADVAIHEGHDPAQPNPHVHVLLTTREIGSEGFGAKVREWNDRALVQQWREAWADHANRALKAAGRDEQIDHRSLADQGITDRLGQGKMGPAAAAIERRGKVSTHGEYVRARAQEHHAIVIDLEQVRTERADLLARPGTQLEVIGQRIETAPQTVRKDAALIAAHGEECARKEFAEQLRQQPEFNEWAMLHRIEEIDKDLQWVGRREASAATFARYTPLRRLLDRRGYETARSDVEHWNRVTAGKDRAALHIERQKLSMCLTEAPTQVAETVDRRVAAARPLVQDAEAARTTLRQIPTVTYKQQQVRTPQPSSAAILTNGVFGALQRMIEQAEKDAERAAQRTRAPEHEGGYER